MINKEKVIKRMTKHCINCSKLPIEIRYYIQDNYPNAFGTYNKCIFCSKKCMIEFLNKKLKKINLVVINDDRK